MVRINPESVLIASSDMVSRKIHDEFILIPITGKVGEGRILGLNEPAEAIWKKLNGKKSLKEIIKELSLSSPKSARRIERDVFEFCNELLRRKMIKRASRK